MNSNRVPAATDDLTQPNDLEGDSGTPTLAYEPKAHTSATPASDHHPLRVDPDRHQPDLIRPQADRAAGVEPVPGYRLEHRLGRGGFGEVWRAVGPGGVSLALKLIRLQDGMEHGEVRALDFMRTIRHPQLIGIAGAWQTEDQLIIAMELADSTLQAALDEALDAGASGLEPVVLAEQMREAAKGIDYLNGLGIVHHDIKPQNLLLMGGGVKVADFGLARFLDASGERSRLSLTPSYAAPELCRGEASGRTDQYALAVTYCKLRGGRLPFSGHHWEVMQKHLHEAPDLSMIPEADRLAVARALSKDPTQRWPDCRSFVAALPSLRQVEFPTPFVPEPVAAAVSRRSFLGAMAGAASLGGAAVGSAAWTKYAASSSPSALAEMRRDEILRDLRFLRSRPFEPIRSAPPGSTEVDQLPPSSNDAFTVLEDERIVDLRGWAPVPDDRPERLTSAVTLIRHVWVRKDRAAATLRFPGRTSGQAIYFQSLNQLPIRQVDQRRLVTTANQQTRVVEAIVDVASIPIGNDFTVSIAATYWNTLQTPDEQWFGVLGYGTASKVAQLLVFPDGKPFLSYQLKTSGLARRDLAGPYLGPAVVLAGPERDWINWDIHSPEEGRLYRVDWTW